MFLSFYILCGNRNSTPTIGTKIKRYRKYTTYGNQSWNINANEVQWVVGNGVACFVKVHCTDKMFDWCYRILTKVKIY